MNLLALPMRMIIRQGRWVARGAGVAMAGLVFEALRRHESIMLPGMDAPYEVASTDPYIGAALAYIIVTKLVRSVIDRFVRAASSHVARIRSGDWFGR